MTSTAIDKIPTEIYNILDDIGVPSHLKGYDYLASAISLVAENPAALNQVTKVIYPGVARQFSTTASRVERAIRHAIESTFVHTEMKVLHKYFGNSIDVMKGKVTNSHFLSTMSRVARRHLMAVES